MLRLGLLGFGSVGRAFAGLLDEAADSISAERGVRLVITGVSTRRSGARMAPGGLDIEEVLAVAASGGTHGPFVDAADFAATCPADVIVETLPLEPTTGATAITATSAALRAGRHVVTANKGPVAHALRELNELARQRGLAYRYESTVADGLPVFNLLRHCLPSAGVTSFTGLLNGTSQLVLDALSVGGTLEAAIAAAQDAGIAEADPSHDLEGWDAAVKVAALSAATWDIAIDPALVARDRVTPESAPAAAAARSRGRRLVSLAQLSLDGAGSPIAAVRLEEIGPLHPFFALVDGSLGLTIRSRLLCPVTVSSTAPGVRDTAYGLLADVLSII